MFHPENIGNTAANVRFGVITIHRDDVVVNRLLPSKTINDVYIVQKMEVLLRSNEHSIRLLHDLGGVENSDDEGADRGGHVSDALSSRSDHTRRLRGKSSVSPLQLAFTPLCFGVRREVQWLSPEAATKLARSRQTPSLLSKICLRSLRHGLLS